MPRAYLILRPQNIIEMFKAHTAAGEPISWSLQSGGLPPDTRFVGLATSGGQWRLELESADFISGETLPQIAFNRTPGCSPEEMKRFGPPSF